MANVSSASAAATRDRGAALDRWDWVLAGVVAVLGLALYGRTLAPSVLLGDSAEFQTLAYTLGMAHNTGYAVYLLLGKFMTLLPIGEVAWRVNLLSAAAAAITLAEVYLLSQLLSGRRIYSIVAAAALGVNALFWWQAIIAEVYTMASAFVLGVLLLIVLWDRTRRDACLIGAGTVGGLAFGVHALVGLVAPAVVIYLVAAEANRRQWLKAALGALTGLLIAAAAYFFVDAVNHPSSIIHTFRAHATAFGLERADFDSPLTRIGFIVFARQWRDQILNSSSLQMLGGIGGYVLALARTFGLLALVLMVVGAVHLLARRPRRDAMLIVLSWLAMLLYIVNYHIGDIEVFYVPTFAVLSVLLAPGLTHIEASVRALVRPWVGEAAWVSVLTTAGLVLIVLLSMGPQREATTASLRQGHITFLSDEDMYWPYPVNDPLGPRLQARRLASMIEEPDAFVLLGWDRLYPFCYVAHVEQHRDGTACIETLPYGTDGRVTRSLRETLHEIIDIRPVYIGSELPELRNEFVFERVPGLEELYRLQKRQ